MCVCLTTRVDISDLGLMIIPNLLGLILVLLFLNSKSYAGFMFTWIRQISKTQITWLLDLSYLDLYDYLIQHI